MLALSVYLSLGINRTRVFKFNNLRSVRYFCLLNHHSILNLTHTTSSVDKDNVTHIIVVFRLTPIDNPMLINASVYIELLRI